LLFFTNVISHCEDLSKNAKLAEIVVCISIAVPVKNSNGDIEGVLIGDLTSG